MASEGFFGGLAGGISDAQTQMLAQQRQRDAEQQQAKATAQKQINDTIKHIGDTVKAGIDGGNDMTKVVAAIQPLVQSAQGLANAAGYDPNYVPSVVQTLLARTPAKPADKFELKPGNTDSLAGPQTVIQHNAATGEIKVLNAATGQPVLNPATDTITPGQAQRANGTFTPPPGTVPQNGSQPATTTADPAALPPESQPTEGTFDARFQQPPAPTPVVNANVDESAIAGLDPKIQGTIKGVAEGTIDPKVIWSLRKGKSGRSERSQMLEYVKAYDPSFDMTNYSARAGTAKAFTSGVEARKLTALGTVIGHTTELYKDGLALDNWKSNTFGVGTKAMNAARMWVKENEQSPIVRNFNLSADAVVNELETAFRQNNTAISGIQEWRKSINPAMASDEIVSATQKLGKLLGARTNELVDQYNRGVGHSANPAITMKLQAVRSLIDKMSAGTLFTDKAVSAASGSRVTSTGVRWGTQ